MGLLTAEVSKDIGNKDIYIFMGKATSFLLKIKATILARLFGQR